MDAIEFIEKIRALSGEIGSVIRPELFPLVDELRTTDPHDLVTPETWFPTENDARGLIWNIFVKRAKKVQQDGL